MHQTSFPNQGFLPTSFQNNIDEPNVPIITRSYNWRSNFDDTHHFDPGSTYQRSRPLKKSSQTAHDLGVARVTTDGEFIESGSTAFGSQVSPAGMSDTDAYNHGYAYVGGTARHSQFGAVFQAQIYYRHVGWSGPGGQAVPEWGEDALFPSIWRGDYNYYVSKISSASSKVKANGNYDNSYGDYLNSTEGYLCIPAVTDLGEQIYCPANGAVQIASARKSRFGRTVDFNGRNCGPYDSIKTFSVLKPTVHPDSLGTVVVEDTSCGNYSDLEPDGWAGQKYTVTTRIYEASMGPIRGWIKDIDNSLAGSANLSIIIAN